MLGVRYGYYRPSVSTTANKFKIIRASVVQGIIISMVEKSKCLSVSIDLPFPRGYNHFYG